MESLRADVRSGALDIARRAAAGLAREALEAPAGTAEELARTLVARGVSVLEAQPAMASLVTLVTAVLEALEAPPGLDSARSGAARAARAFEAEVQGCTGEVAARAAPLLPRGSRVLTLSTSATVREALLAHPDRDGFHVYVLEGRPALEGRLLAADLARGGLEVTLAVDAAAAALAAQADLVLTGADSVGDLGVVNKLGTLALAGAALREGIPCFVLADRTKILPPGFPQHLGDHRPGEEVWAAPEGVGLWNRYFEPCPLGLVTSVVTGTAVLPPSELEAYRRDIRVPAVLGDWAARRGSGSGRAVRSGGPSQ